MPLIGISIKLERIDGGFWLSCVCTLDEDAKGRMIVAQSIPKERYAVGEKGPAVGTWREIGGGNHSSSGKPVFDLARYKPPPPTEQTPPAPEQEPPATGGTGDAFPFPDEGGATR
jgi:hypothetical protein